jgi:HEAT repeat protein
VNINSQVNLWKQGQVAHSTANWSLLLQCLQQLIVEEKVLTQNQNTPSVAEAIAFSEPDAALVQLTNWAMDVFTFGDFHQRWDIAKLLPQLGESALNQLIEILDDEDADEELRWFTVRSLGQFDRPDVIATLVERLKTSESEDEKAMAVTALAEIGTNAVAALTELLAEENTRLLAVRSLSHIRRQETIAPLLSIVQDPQTEIRAAAIEALSSFHDPRIPPVLLAALDDLAAPVRREAVIGLSFRPDLREELDLINRLLPRLYDFNLDVCAAAAIALGRLGTDAAATGLFQVLQSPHTPVALQIEIIRALGRVETATSLEYLRASLHQLTSVTLEQEIVTVLGRVEQPELKTKAAQILIGLLRSPHQATQHASIKQVIALSLGQLGEMQALEALIELLADADAAVRLHAIAALKNLAPETARQQLEQLALNKSLAQELKQGVAIALKEWSSNSSEL